MFLISSEYYQAKSAKKKGRGLFAKKEIAPGTLIGDYLGKVLAAKDSDKLEQKTQLFYAMDYANTLAIWPEDYRALGVHLINHSCTPNCDTFYYYNRSGWAGSCSC